MPSSLINSKALVLFCFLLKCIKKSQKKMYELFLPKRELDEKALDVEEWPFAVFDVVL